MPVKVEPALLEEISKSILKNTTLEAERWVDVRSRRQGQVVAILKEEGDAVRDGETLARLAHNDFEEPLFTRHPELDDCRRVLRESGAIVAQVTGSGSALFAVFGDASARTEAAARMRGSGFDRESGWLALETRLPA